MVQIKYPYYSHGERPEVMQKLFGYPHWGVSPGCKTRALKTNQPAGRQAGGLKHTAIIIKFVSAQEMPAMVFTLSPNI